MVAQLISDPYTLPPLDSTHLVADLMVNNHLVSNDLLVSYALMQEAVQDLGNMQTVLCDCQGNH